MLWKRKTQAPGLKTSPPSTCRKYALRKIVAVHKVYNEPSKPTLLHVLEPSKFQLATDFTEPVLFLAYQRPSIETPMVSPPMRIGFRLWLIKFPFSLIHSQVCVCGWGMCLQNLYQWYERDGKGRWRTWFFSKKKLSIFIQKIFLHTLGTFKVSRVWSVLLKPFAMPYSCVYVCAGRKIVVGAFCKV